MSFRRSLSFKDRELKLVKIYDENGGSDFAKMCIRFYLEYKDKVVISSGVKQVVNNFEKKVDKSKVNKLFK